jgi:Holliday junction resolvasome RuvABC endonuclease subunit
MRLRMGTADMIVVEGMPAHAPSQRGVMDRAELYGVLRMTAYDAGIPFREVNITHIKMFATGKGNANKDAMLAAAIRRFGYDGTSNDEADALILWHLCKRALGEGLRSLPQAHERCLDAVREVLL